ncbi:MAG: substrate-binding domain-containing protein, partial [Akkermansiaceae bacterium]
QEIPAFALFGRRRGVAIPGIGPDKIPAYRAATRRLGLLGHRRIVLMTSEARRLPRPGAPETAFLEELQVLGIQPSAYHLPDWEETASGFHACLESLFRITAPTAMIVDESHFFLAVMQYCGSRGFRIPEDVSLISTDYDPRFSWFTPDVAHIRWSQEAQVNRVDRWLANVSRGKEDLRQTFTKAEFVEGGTIGPVNR